MAKIRDLKKDVSFLTTELISQAFFTQYLFPELSEKGISKIIEKAILLKNDTIAAINSKSNEKASKAYYRKLQEEFLKKYYKLLEDLEKLKK